MAAGVRRHGVTSGVRCHRVPSGGGRGTCCSVVCAQLTESKPFPVVDICTVRAGQKLFLQCLCQWSDVAANRRETTRRIIKAHAAARRGMCRRILRTLVQHAYEQHSARRKHVMEQRVDEHLKLKHRDFCAGITRAWRARVQELAQERRGQAARCKRREQMQAVLDAASRRALEDNACHDSCPCDPPHGQKHGAQALCRGCRISSGDTTCRQDAHGRGHADDSSFSPAGADSQPGTDVDVGGDSGSGWRGSDVLSQEGDVLSEELAPSPGRASRASASASRGGERKRSRQRDTVFHTSCQAMAERQVTQSRC